MSCPHCPHCQDPEWFDNLMHDEFFNRIYRELFTSDFANYHRPICLRIQEAI